ncbi:MAG: TPM domain-containing protein [Pseudomonadales bacterium]|nr:TPM domain-containing protein [Pseudomonadales bacterium]
MSMLDESELKRVARAISQVEQKTDARLFTVLARQADDYRIFPYLWSALIAMLTPLIIELSPWWVETWEIFVIQLGAFTFLTMVLRTPALMNIMVPTEVKQWRASDLARRQFLEHQLHHSRESGVLIFVSEAEHYVEIIADRSLSRRITTDDWQHVIDTLIMHIRTRDTVSGFVTAIEQCGTLLAKHAPITRDKVAVERHLLVI